MIEPLLTHRSVAVFINVFAVSRTSRLAVDGDPTVDYCRSTWCTKATAIDPSPTADATRLILPPRTSPTAKMRGRLVSSRYGGRASGHFARASCSDDRSG